MRNRAYLRLRVFFTRNYEAIKLGMLSALFVVSILMLNNQARQMGQILEINEHMQALVEQDAIHRDEYRKEAAKRDDRIVAFLRCIALIPYGQRDEANFNRCVDNSGQVTGSVNTPEIAPEPAREERRATIIPTPRQDTPRQEPTTSEPPEPPQPEQGLVGGRIKTLDRTLDSLRGRLGL